MDILHINLSIYFWLLSQKNSPSIACLRTKPCPPDFSMMPFEMKVKPIFHQREKHMEWVRQDEVWEKGRNRFKMGLDLCQDAWHEASYRAPLPAPDWREAGVLILRDHWFLSWRQFQGTLMFWVWKKLNYVASTGLLQPGGGDVVCFCQQWSLGFAAS